MSEKRQECRICGGDKQRYSFDPLGCSCPPETFTGKLEWITITGNIDVRHPDGRLIRCYASAPEHELEAKRLGKSAYVTVEIPRDIPGRGKYDPRTLSVSSAPTSQP